MAIICPRRSAVSRVCVSKPFAQGCDNPGEAGQQQPCPARQCLGVHCAKLIKHAQNPPLLFSDTCFGEHLEWVTSHLAARINASWCTVEANRNHSKPPQAIAPFQAAPSLASQSIWVYNPIVNMLTKTMPHFQIDDSANLEDLLGMAACAKKSGPQRLIAAPPSPGIRAPPAWTTLRWQMAIPAMALSTCPSGCAKPPGSCQTAAAGAAVFAALEAFVAPVMQTRSIAISVEMRDINAALSPKGDQCGHIWGRRNDST